MQKINPYFYSILHHRNLLLIISSLYFPLNADTVRPLVDVRRKLFEPLKESNREKDDDKRSRLFEGLQNVAPGGCYEAMFDKNLQTRNLETDDLRVVIDNIAVDEPDCTLLSDPYPPDENVILTY